MAISLNNHETRIKALEDKLSSGGAYTTGTGTNGRWFKFADGLIIQCGKSGSGTKTFPIPFPTVCSGFVTAGTNPTSSYNTTSFNFNDMSFGTSAKPGSVPWLAIGYLITYRVKNWLFNKILTVKGLI